MCSFRPLDTNNIFTTYENILLTKIFQTTILGFAIKHSKFDSVNLKQQ